MRVPLDGFFCEALAHFGIAPTQLTPNGWRFLAGFLGLCRSVGVPPSLAVFRRFFLLPTVTQRQKKGWYFCRSRKSSGLRFTGLPDPNSISFRYWKHEFFFLSSPEPWPCPVKWGNPSKSSLRNPVLTDEEEKWAAKLLRAHGAAAIDLRKYICNTNLTTLLPLPAPPSSSPKGMDPSVYAMMKTMLAEKAAAQASASAKKVKAEPGIKAAGSRPLCGKKRSLEEANDKECSPPPGFSRKPQHFLSRRNGDVTGRVDTRGQLEEAKREAEQEMAKADLAATGAGVAKANAGLAAAEAEVVKARTELTAAKRSAVAEQEKVRREHAMEVAKANAKLAAAKRTLEEELQSAKAAAARQLLCCDDHVRRRAEHALERYRRWRTDRAPAGPAA
uniref:Uncharacterized protein n=1 Tax=Avena sativa TaxID=4498 RepID=A0ACD5ZQA5_AVESA